MLTPSEDDMKKLLELPNRVIKNGLGKYLVEGDERNQWKKIEDWNGLIACEDTYEEFSKIRNNWPDETWYEFGQKILLAQLIIASSDYLLGTDSMISKRFPPVAYEIVEKFDDFSIFSSFSWEKIVELIAQTDDTIIGFIKKYCDGQLYNYDRILKEKGIEDDIRLALESYYSDIFEKIQKAITEYINTHPGTWRKVFHEIDEYYQAVIEAQTERIKTQTEVKEKILTQEIINEFEKKLDQLEIDRLVLTLKLSQAEKSLIDEKTSKEVVLSNIQHLEKEKRIIQQQHEDLIAQWDKIHSSLELKRSEILKKEMDLEEEKVRLEKENQLFINEELERIKEIEYELRNEEQSFLDAKSDLMHKNNVLSDRIKKLRLALETGEKGNIVRQDIARGMEHVFIERFNQNVVNRLNDPEIRSNLMKHGFVWNTISKNESNELDSLFSIGIDHAMIAKIPMNRSVILTAEKKHHFTKNEPVLHMEGRIITHPDMYIENGYDNVSVSLSEVLPYVEETIRDRNIDGITHILYIGSPTGFDTSVLKFFTSGIKSAPLFHENVFVFLQDLKEPSEVPSYYALNEKSNLFCEVINFGVDSEFIELAKLQILKMFDSVSPLAHKDLIEGIALNSRYIEQGLESLINEGVLGKDDHRDFDSVYYKMGEK